ncbi:hypothetical protein WI72_08905 [Burkholderia ubonensis]|uniref:hypothetical protein n=1 Tax=Burkholderia ubonensis TaxID=101571 RepID=UPI000755837D|nr:hypothetical protein [Burkholderia ubonensis]KVC63925.1 hypothetical protein WI72_08905 [Burkholderia ubonensis]KVD92856.1 hypothetical protein WI90_10355 [Burkholderia ubonensis]
MTEKHSPIAGFRIVRPAARRGRTMREHRPIWRSEVRQLIEELLVNELRRSLTRVTRTSAVEPIARPTSEPASRPPRKVFNVGRIDPSKCKLPVISEAEAKAIGGRETCMHFGLDPDLYSAT